MLFFSLFLLFVGLWHQPNSFPPKKMKRSPIVTHSGTQKNCPKLGSIPSFTPSFAQKTALRAPCDSVLVNKKQLFWAVLCNCLPTSSFCDYVACFPPIFTVFFVFCGFPLWDHTPHGDLTQPQPLPQLQSLLKPNNKKCHFWSHCYQSQIFFAAILQTILRMQGSFASLGAMIDIDMECQLDWCPCRFTIQKSIFLWQTMRNKENKIMESILHLFTSFYKKIDSIVIICNFRSMIDNENQLNWFDWTNLPFKINFFFNKLWQKKQSSNLFFVLFCVKHTKTTSQFQLFALNTNTFWHWMPTKSWHSHGHVQHKTCVPKIGISCIVFVMTHMHGLLF